MNKKEEKKYPEPAAGALIRNNEGKFLFIKANFWGGKYTVPGGHVELGETMEDTVKREVKEETGLDVGGVVQLGLDESIYSKEDKKNKHFIFLDFLCEYDGGSDAIKPNEEFDGQGKWVTIEEAEKLDLSHGTRKIVQRYIDYKKSQEYLDGWKRCQADFENYKKRQSESQKDFVKFSCQSVVMEILPILDNFYTSTDHIPAEQKDTPWVVGIMHIQKQLEDVLKNYGVTEIETKIGDEFNPEIHEAIKETTEHKTQSIEHETQNMEHGNKINKIVQRGYKIDNKVVRPTRVIVD